MSERGVFAVDRGIWDDPDFAAEPYTEREAFMWLVSATAWTERRIRGGSAGAITLKRGEFSFSVRFLGEKWSWSKSRVSRFLNKLEKRDTIKDVSRDTATIFFIKNYNRFQVVGLPSGTREAPVDGTKLGQQRDTSGTGVGQQRDKEETLKHLNIENIENQKVSTAPQAAPPSKPKRRSHTPLPEDCPSVAAQGDAMQFWGVHARFDLADQLEDQIAQFRDHHLKTGSTMADWDAAWRTWFRNALKFNKQERANGPGRERPPSRVDNAVRGAGQFLEAARGSAEESAGGRASGITVVARAVHGPTSEADDHPRANGPAPPGPRRDLSVADAFARSDDAEIPGLLRRSAAPIGG